MLDDPSTGFTEFAGFSELSGSAELSELSELSGSSGSSGSAGSAGSAEFPVAAGMSGSHSGDSAARSGHDARSGAAAPSGRAEIAALADRVATARGKLPLQTDPALFAELSEAEITAERELAEWIRTQRRAQRRRAVTAELAAEKRDRRVGGAIRRAEDADARWHRKALAARRRVSSPDARLAQLFRRAEWSSRALIGVVVLGMVWAGVNVQHNLVPSGDMSDPLYWLSYGLEAMISIPIITIMVVATTAARWGRDIARGKVVLLEAVLLGTTISLNAGPHLAAHDLAQAAEAAVAPVMVGVVIWLHAWVSARYAQLIDGSPVSEMTEPARTVEAVRTDAGYDYDAAERISAARALGPRFAEYESRLGTGGFAAESFGARSGAAMAAATATRAERTVRGEFARGNVAGGAVSPPSTRLDHSAVADGGVGQGISFQHNDFQPDDCQHRDIRHEGSRHGGAQHNRAEHDSIGGRGVQNDGVGAADGVGNTRIANGSIQHNGFTHNDFEYNDFEQNGFEHSEPTVVDRHDGPLGARPRTNDAPGEGDTPQVERSGSAGHTNGHTRPVIAYSLPHPIADDDLGPAGDHSTGTRNGDWLHNGYHRPVTAPEFGVDSPGVEPHGTDHRNTDHRNGHRHPATEAPPNGSDARADLPDAALAAASEPIEQIGTTNGHRHNGRNPGEATNDSPDQFGAVNDSASHAPQSTPAPTAPASSELSTAAADVRTPPAAPDRPATGRNGADRQQPPSGPAPTMRDERSLKLPIEADRIPPHRPDAGEASGDIGKSHARHTSRTTNGRTATAEHPAARVAIAVAAVDPHTANSEAAQDDSGERRKSRTREAIERAAQLTLDEHAATEARTGRRYLPSDTAPIDDNPTGAVDDNLDLADAAAESDWVDMDDDLAADAGDIELWSVAREISARGLSKLSVEQLAEILTLTDESWTPAAIGTAIGMPGSRVLGILEAARRIRPHAVSS